VVDLVIVVVNAYGWRPKTKGCTTQSIWHNIRVYFQKDLLSTQPKI